MSEVRWERMFPDQLEAAFARRPVLYLPYGMCEPHGPHNAIGLDGLKAHAIACRAARRHGGIVAPPDWWHVHEVGGYGVWGARTIGEVRRKWMTAVPPAVHFRNVCYHIRTADSLGFHAAILLTGHYGPNWEDLKTLVALLQPRVGTRLYGLPDFEANTPGFDKDGKSGGDHAGKVETSLLMALEPGLTDTGRFPAGSEGSLPWAMGHDARLSRRRTGRRMVNDEVAFLGQKCAELLAEYARLAPRHTFRTFIDVESAWRELVLPRLASFASLGMDFSGPHEKLGPESVWFENLRNPDAP